MKYFCFFNGCCTVCGFLGVLVTIISLAQMEGELYLYYGIPETKGTKQGFLIISLLILILDTILCGFLTFKTKEASSMLAEGNKFVEVTNPHSPSVPATIGTLVPALPAV